MLLRYSVDSFRVGIGTSLCVKSGPADLNYFTYIILEPVVLEK